MFTATTEEPQPSESPEAALAEMSPKVAAMVDDIAALNLMEMSQLTKGLKVCFYLHLS
jgi:hypothetical protein